LLKEAFDGLEKKQLEGTFTEVWIFQMPPTDVFG